MKVKHVFGGHVYLISNYGVALNPIFKDEEDLAVFKEKFDQYLSDICEVFAASHQINQFQYLVKVKERSELESFYLKKMEGKKKNIAHDLYKETDAIPESYLIFSQEVSNFLNSVAKKFNFRHGRRGSLFADRYCKILVESEEEMQDWIDRLSECEPLFEFTDSWQVGEDIKGPFDCDASIILAVSDEMRIDLRGCFETLPPFHVKSNLFNQKFQNYVKIHGKNPPW